MSILASTIAGEIVATCVTRKSAAIVFITYKVHAFLTSMRKGLDYLHHLSIEKWQKMQMPF